MAAGATAASIRYCHPQRLWIALLAGVMLIAVGRMVHLVTTHSGPASLPEGMYQVHHVCDSGELRLAIGERVGLQAVLLPKRPTSAVAKMRDFVAAADQTVRLSFGPERVDKHGRHLAFVWHGQQCLNLALVREQLAQPLLEHRHAGAMRNQLAQAIRETDTLGAPE